MAEKPIPENKVPETQGKRSPLLDVNNDVELDLNKKDDIEGEKKLECAICLQSCVHPARLPCGHIFCFLCLKGIAHGSKKCAMCRHPIPRDYLDNPDLLEVPSDYLKEQEDKEDYHWYYEGRNGWWQYDRRAGAELEAAWSGGEDTCELLIAGYLYTVDFKAMIQARRSEPGRQRNIKRDLSNCPKKGVAGIRDPDLCQGMSMLTLNDDRGQ